MYEHTRRVLKRNSVTAGPEKGGRGSGTSTTGRLEATLPAAPPSALARAQPRHHTALTRTCEGNAGPGGSRHRTQAAGNRAHQLGVVDRVRVWYGSGKISATAEVTRRPHIGLSSPLLHTAHTITSRQHVFAVWSLEDKNFCTHTQEDGVHPRSLSVKGTFLVLFQVHLNGEQTTGCEVTRSYKGGMNEGHTTAKTSASVRGQSLVPVSVQDPLPSRSG